MKKLAAAFAVTMLGMITLLSGNVFAQEGAEETEEIFAEWNQDAPALQALIEYVETVTDESSPDYIPPADRIATFDMDGTLCAELCPTYLEYYLLAWRILKDPSYEPDAEMLEFGRMLRDHAIEKDFPDHMDLLHAVHAAEAYAGLTLDEFSDFVTERLLAEVDGFEGMTYAESFYLPMIEVVDYLNENGFTTYICSGSDRFICRTFVEGMVDVPADRIIGMDVALEAANQGDADGLDYVYTDDDTLVRTDTLQIKNLKMNKVLAIAKEIGRQPVLSFGNSGGDVSMHNYTIFDNPYRSLAFMLIADDEERDYGNYEKAQELRQKWEDSGYIVVSMKDDFRTIYGDDVVKTGSFNWLEDLAEDRVPADAAASAEEAAPEEPAPQEAAPEQAAPGQGPAPTQGPAPGGAEGMPEDANLQFVLYLGTNGKDSNKPVFTQGEAMEAATDILIDRFGGYTIQEATGGWIDGDKEYQEYTLVIYLSDTTIDEVHAAADELLEVFDQSAVLIQSNPTRAEFYSGSM